MNAPIVFLALIIFSSGIMLGTVIGLYSERRDTTTRFQKEAIAAGVAEWVTISDPFSTEKPVLEFRFKTPAPTR